MVQDWGGGHPRRRPAHSFTSWHDPYGITVSPVVLDSHQARLEDVLVRPVGAVSDQSLASVVYDGYGAFRVEKSTGAAQKETKQTGKDY